MVYQEYGGHVDEPLKGTDSVAIVSNRETYFLMDTNREGLYRQLEVLPRLHKVERVYHGLDFPAVFSRLEEAVRAANLRVEGVKRPLHTKIDFTRRLTKMNS